MKKIITFGLTENLISKISSYIYDNYVMRGKDPGRLAIVFGGKRPSLFMRRELADRIGSGYFSPRFFSMNEFVENIVSRETSFSAISEMDASYIIYKLTKSIAPEMIKERNTFSRFLPWASEILAFIEHADREKINENALENVQRNADIGYDVPASVNALLKNINIIRNNFHRALLEKKSYSRGFAYLLASEHIKETCFDDFDEIFFCGLFYLHGTESEIINTLYSKGKATLFFQGDAKDWPVLEKVSNGLSCAIQPETTILPEYKMKLYAGYDMHSQIALAREIIKNIGSPEKTVLVMPDPGAVIPFLSEIASITKDLNVSIGYPVKRSSLYSLLENVFRSQETKKGEGYYAKDYLRAISHPLVKNIRLLYEPAVTRVLVHKAEEMLAGAEKSNLNGRLFFQLDDICECKELYEAASGTLAKMNITVKEKQLEEVMVKLNGLLFSMWENVTDFSAFSEALEKFLDKLVKNSYIASYPLNIKVVERLFEISGELKTALFSSEKFSSEEIFKIALDRLSNDMASFAGSPLKGLQVLGIMESRSLNFENVIMIDVNESVLPQVNTQEPLIPRDVMLAAGFDRLEKEEEIQRYQFMRLISSAKNVHLVYSENKKKEKSRFLEELIWNKQRADNSLDAITVQRALLEVKIAPEKLPKPKSGEMVSFLKKLRYSATKINTYLECPTKFYFRYVLGLEEKMEIPDELEGADIGLLIHDILEESFRGFEGIKPVIDESFRELFLRIIDNKFEDTFKMKMKSDAFLIKEVIDYRMRIFFEAEKIRPVKKIVALESAFSKEFKFPSGSYLFYARVDRIDMLEDDSLMVIDYKTGSAGRQQKKIKDIPMADLNRESIKNAVESFQLPVYLRLTEDHYPGVNVNAALYNLRSSELDMFFKDLSEDEKEGKMGTFMKYLDYILKEIVDINIPFTADDRNRKKCGMCPFLYSCR